MTATPRWWAAQITITAVRAVTDWTAVLTLPPGVDVSTSWEADYHQSGRTLTFTPTAPNRSPHGGGDLPDRGTVGPRSLLREINR